MAIGTTSDFNLTRNRLIKRAFSRIGIGEPSDEDMAFGVETLNEMIRSLDARGRWLHAISTSPSSLTLVGGQRAYVTGSLATNINPRIIQLIHVGLKQGNTQIDMNIVTVDSIVRADLITGQPTDVYFEKHADPAENRLIFDPIPNQAYEMLYTFRRPLYDFASAGENPDFPSEALKALRYQLAYELSPDYGKSVTEQQKLQLDAEIEMETIRTFLGRPDTDAPNPTEFF